MVPTPTMTPWPGMSRGTDCTVPMVPGVGDAHGDAGEIVGAQDRCCAPCGPWCRSARRSWGSRAWSASGMHGTSSVRDPSAFSTSTAMPRPMWSWTHHSGAGVGLDEGGVHHRHVAGDGLHHGVGDQMGVRHLAPVGAAQVAVDDPAVDVEQFGRNFPEAGGRWGQPRPGLHVAGDAGCRSLAAGRPAGTRGAAAGGDGVTGSGAGLGRGVLLGGRLGPRCPTGGPAGAGLRGMPGRRLPGRGGSRKRSPASSRSPRRGSARYWRCISSTSQAFWPTSCSASGAMLRVYGQVRH